MRLPVMFVTGNALNICLVAFSEAPSDSTWLENAEVRFPTHSFPGNSLNFSLVAFSEPPSDSTWLENAPNDPPTKKPTAPKRDGLF